MSLYKAGNFEGTWKCIGSARFSEFCTVIGMDKDDAAAAEASRPIVYITATEHGFKEKIVLPNADNEVFDESDYQFGQMFKSMDSSVTWTFKDAFTLIGKYKNLDGSDYTVTRTLDSSKNQVTQELQCGILKAIRKFARQ